MKNNKRMLLLLLLGSLSTVTQAQTQAQVQAQTQSWPSWVADVRREALGQGISSELFDQAFADIHEPSRQVKGLARSQPEHRLTYSKYLHSRVDSYRIVMGRKYYTQNKALLEKIAAHQ